MSRLQRAALIITFSGVLLAAGVILLGKTSDPEPVDFLKDRPLVDSGFFRTALLSDVIVPCEYRSYSWREPYLSTMRELSKELLRTGYRLDHESEIGTSWQRGKQVVILEGKQLERSSKPGRMPLTIDDPNWTMVTVLRHLDENWLTQFRIWLFDVRPD